MGPLRSHTGGIFYTSLRRAPLGIGPLCNGWIRLKETYRGENSSPPQKKDFIVRCEQVARQTSMLCVDFLQIDCNMALTYTGIALETDDPQKGKRMTQIARRAYDTIERLRTNVELSHAEGNKLDANVHRLKSELQRLGQCF